MKTVLIVLCCLLSGYLKAQDIPGLKTYQIHRSSIGCSAMNAQILAKKDSKDFYASVGGYCLSGEFYDDVPLKIAVPVRNILKVGNVECGTIETVQDLQFVKLDKSVCSFHISKRTTYLSTYTYSGGGELIATLPPRSVTGFGVYTKYILDDRNTPSIVYGTDWDKAERSFENEYSRYSSKDLTYKQGELFFKGKPCGTIDLDTNNLITFTSDKYKCKIHEKEVGESKEIYLFPSGPEWFSKL